MLRMKRIVLPTDFSAKSAVLAAHARILALQAGAEVVIVHVMRPFHLAVEGVDVPAAVVSDWYNEQKPRVEKQLHDFASIYFKDCPVRTVFREGEPAHEIIEAAKAEDADVIMLSTHGYGAFRRLLLGSIAAKVMHDSHIPVLTSAHVEFPEHETEQIETVLVAVDLSPRAPLMIAAAADLAKEFGAKLHVVHATPDEGDGASRYLDHAWREEVALRVQAALEEYLVEARAEAELHILSGNTSKVVAHVAEKTGAGLVVIGRHKSHGYDIVRHSPAPVLSLGQ
jgi:nucleotide-binding universal stress UspA family protein